MPVSHATTVSTSMLINPNKDRRLHKRIALNLVGRLLDETSADHDVRTVDISCSGAMIRSAHKPLPGAQVICYFNDPYRPPGLCRAVQGGPAQARQAR